MSPRSLQNRLLLGFFVSMTVILTVGGFVIYQVIDKHLVSDNDALVRERLAYYESTLRLKPNRIGGTEAYFHFMPREWELTTPAENPDLFQAWYADSDKEIERPRIGKLLKRALPRPVVKGD